MKYKVEWRDGLGDWNEDSIFDTQEAAIEYAREEYKRMREIKKNTPHRVVLAPEEPVYTTWEDETL